MACIDLTIHYFRLFCSCCTVYLFLFFPVYLHIHSFLTLSRCYSVAIVWAPVYSFCFFFLNIEARTFIQIHAFRTAYSAFGACSAFDTACSAFGTACFAFDTACSAFDTACSAFGTACFAFGTACSAFGKVCSAFDTACSAYNACSIFSFPVLPSVVPWSLLYSSFVTTALAFLNLNGYCRYWLLCHFRCIVCQRLSRLHFEDYMQVLWLSALFMHFVLAVNCLCTGCILAVYYFAQVE